ncbi:MAG: outer membrane lipoprotein carrier protein LolA [Desulfobacteraceae bacterium]|nr:outer membrane lipoprotein carrier protein LolA [Desulfobacteraceae bacterium]
MLINIKNHVFLILFVFLIIIMGSMGPGFAMDLKPIPQNQLDQILVDVGKNFSEIKTMKTLLTQEKNLSLFSQTVISKGFCIFKRPGKLRLEFTQPFKSALMVNKNQVYKYEYFNGTWKKLNPGNKEIMRIVMNHITSWLSGKFNENNLYEVTGFFRPEVTILLTPKSDEFKKFIGSFELGLNKQLNGLDYIIINETGKDFTKIRFYNDRLNGKIPDNLFDGSQNAPHPVTKW